ncbi:MAG: KilA-N domain-containing protein [Rikenellaceae bacterium]
MENLKIFEYNDMPISFITSDDGEPMVNATEMAKVFKKDARRWFANQSTFDYIEAFATIKGFGATDKIPLSLNTNTLAKRYPALITVVKGGDQNITQQGIFLSRYIAIEFARWLSPMFAVWCDERIMEYLQFGFTASDDALLQMQSDPNFAKNMAEELSAEREKNRALEQQNTQLLNEAEENRPKVNFYDNVSNLNDDYNKRRTIVISKVASRFKINVKTLNKFLIRKKVIIRVDGGYDIHPQYANKGIAYQIVKEETEYDEYGDILYPGIKFMEYTPDGVELITKHLMEDGMIKKENN